MTCSFYWCARNNYAGDMGHKLAGLHEAGEKSEKGDGLGGN